MEWGKKSKKKNKIVVDEGAVSSGANYPKNI